MAFYNIVVFSSRRSVAVLIARIISNATNRVTWCATQKQLLEICERVQPEMVIIVAMTPFVDGSGFVDMIRTCQRKRPTIYVIGWQQNPRLVLSLLESGVDQYLTFPISMFRLYNKANYNISE